MPTTNLTWFGWVLMAYFIYATLLVINRVGKARKPLEPNAAVIATVISGFIIAGILFIGTGAL
jgi:hypothetical protein